MPKKITTVSAAKRKADRIFSQLVRKSAANEYGGWIKCVTCGSMVGWADADAGHFESRRHNGTRYD